MGDCVGTIFYGVQINRKDFERINKNIGWKKDKNGVNLENPYETDDYFVIIEDSKKSAYNGSMPIDLAADMAIKPEWAGYLKAFYHQHEIERPMEEHQTIENLNPTWFLAGHYN